MSETNKKNNVELIDPNDSDLIGTNNNQSIPLEKMYIFVELFSTRRGRTVIEGNDVGNKQIITNMETTKIASFMGYGNKYGEDLYTTDYLLNTANNVETFGDGFGMTKIDIKVGANKVPSVNIEFVDVKGMTFFNPNSKKMDSSPYSMILDFPPPIFTLIVKGYFGQAVRYDLHIVKNSVRFESNSGNFYISAEFVGRTFAPLADIPFAYVKTFGIMRDTTTNDSDGFTPSQSQKPKNTYDLLSKLKLLYSEIGNSPNISDENQTLNNNNDKIEGYTTVLGMIYDFPAVSKLEGSAGLYEYDSNLINGYDIGSMVQLINPKNDMEGAYSSAFADGNNSPLGKKYYLGVKTANSINIPNTSSNNSGNVYNSDFKDVAGIDKSIIITSYDNYIKEVISTAKKKGINLRKDLFVGPTKLVISSKSNDSGEEYYVVDITDLYANILKSRQSLKDNIAISKNKITDNINSLTQKIVGMELTVKNIFEIICNDVDWVFRKMRNVAEKAETEHTKFANIYIKDRKLTNTENINDNKIFAYPLYYKNQSINSGVNGQIVKEVRTIPDDLSKMNPDYPFPEILLVDEFINAFVTMKSAEKSALIRGEIDDTTNQKKWLPLCGADINESQYSSIAPYSQITNVSIETNINNIFGIVLNRFYILSQYVYKINNFFKDDGDKGLYNTLREFYAEGEAINLYNSIKDNTNLLNLIKTQSLSYKNNLSSFYKNSAENFALNGVKPIITGKEYQPLYLDDLDTYSTKMAKLTKSVEIFNGDQITTIDKTDELTDGPLKNLLDLQKTKAWYKRWFNIYDDVDNIPSYFTSGNLPYYNNYNRDSVMNKDYIDGEPLQTTRTRFLYWYDTTSSYTDYISTDFKGRNSDLRITTTSLGNSDDERLENKWFEIMFNGKLVIPHMKSLVDNNDIDSRKIFMFHILSTFSRTRSIFNVRNDFNKQFFRPGMYSLPQFELAYLGGLVYLYENNNSYDIVIKFYSEYAEKLKTVWLGYPIAADKNDIGLFVVENDRNILLKFFEDFVDAHYQYYSEFFYSLNSSDTGVNLQNALRSQDNSIFYAPLLEKKWLSIFSENTFNNYSDGNKTFQTLPIIASTIKGDSIGHYFNKFFDKLINLISEVEEKKKDEVNNTINKDTKVSDNDIRTETYYSMKNINDKWITAMKSNTTYPFDNNATKLIDKFVFVDRGFNDIGDACYINFEALLDADNDFESSVFSVMSRLLSINGFEFFPVANFINTDKEWYKSFMPTENGIVNSTPSFVCMYVGGSASYPATNNENAFKDDGVLTLENPPSDIGSSTATIHAFKVRYGIENQSYFTDFKLDGQEFKETNESLAILSRIAGDESTSMPTPKGQNLFGLYENRAYQATVSMFGNAMIQPTQYFQLENIPLFNGAYLITEVNHTITPNKMSTEAIGTKILKYPKPIVTDFATSMGYQSGGDTTSDSDSIVLDSNLYGTYTPESVPSNQRYNAIFLTKLNTGIKKLNQVTCKHIIDTMSNIDSVLVSPTYNNPSFGNNSNYYPSLGSTYKITSSARYNGNVISDAKIASSAVIYWIEKYSEMYGVDPHFIAAQIDSESKFKFSVSSKNERGRLNAMGITQFVTSTFYDVAIERGALILGASESKKIISALTIGISNPTQRSTYIPKNDVDWERFRTNQPKLYQNMANNPEYMIQMQCAYMSYIGKMNNNVLATALLFYNQGGSFYSGPSGGIGSKFAADSTKNGTYYYAYRTLRIYYANSPKNVSEGVNYVTNTFNLLKNKFNYPMDIGFDSFKCQAR